MKCRGWDGKWERTTQCRLGSSGSSCEEGYVLVMKKMTYVMEGVTDLTLLRVEQWCDVGTRRLWTWRSVLHQVDSVKSKPNMLISSSSFIAYLHNSQRLVSLSSLLYIPAIILRSKNIYARMFTDCLVLKSVLTMTKSSRNVKPHQTYETRDISFSFIFLSSPD